jgi:hypothetical protein
MRHPVAVDFGLDRWLYGAMENGRDEFVDALLNSPHVLWVWHLRSKSDNTQPTIGHVSKHKNVIVETFEGGDASGEWEPIQAFDDRVFQEQLVVRTRWCLESIKNWEFGQKNRPLPRLARSVEESRQFAKDLRLYEGFHRGHWRDRFLAQRPLGVGGLGRARGVKGELGAIPKEEGAMHSFQLTQ